MGGLRRKITDYSLLRGKLDFLLISHVILDVLTVDCISGELNRGWAD